MKLLQRVVHILEALAESPDGLSLTQIAQIARIPTSSVHRILASLQSFDLVEQNRADRQYRLGYALVKLAQPVLARLSQYWEVTPYLCEIRDQWNECCYLGSLVDDQVLCLQAVEVNDPQRMRFYVHPGRSMPLNCAAGGKVILAYQHEEEIERILAKTELHAFTPQTIVDKEGLKQHLLVIRDRGHALCEEELEIGVSAVAVPVGTTRGKVKSCIAVVAPSARLQIHLRDGLVEMLKSVSERVNLCLIARN